MDSAENENRRNKWHLHLKTQLRVSLNGCCAVCPAATLLAHRIRSTGYKKRDLTEERREIVTALRAKLTIGKLVPDLAQSADLVDAAVCVLASDDFLAGRAMPPENRSLAEHEGWIWVAGPES